MRWCLFATLLTCLQAQLVFASDSADRSALKIGGHANEYVGSDSCKSCHAPIYDQWRGSHHQQAMQVADESSVLGDFNNATFSYGGVVTRFFVEDQQLKVETDNVQGKMQVFDVVYTFGVMPLQQYLLDVGQGRLQALGIAWDTRKKEEGGQRWFHLYQNSDGTEPINYRDPLHWTRHPFTWNLNCAECHSTNLEKRYEPASNSYDTRWSEISVGCEACHGEAKQHLAWAAENSRKPSARSSSPAIEALKSDSRWHLKKDLPNALRTGGVENAQQIDACGHCHSRRSTHQPPAESSSNASFLDQHTLSLIENQLYWPDGQIREEVYVYGSFLQSKMHRAGVVCSDCHNPHTLALKLPDDQVCSQCHQPSVYATKAHHHHAEGGEGANCLSCHMPSTTYMQVDPRRDHSLRVPRPDLTANTGAPSACHSCHEKQGSAWLGAAFARWYPQRAQTGHFGSAFAAAFNGQVTPTLESLATNQTIAPMVRASALALLAQQPSPENLRRAGQALTSNKDLVRLGAIRAFANAGPEQLSPLLGLLDDPISAVRYEAAQQLLGATGLSPIQSQLLNKVLDERIASQRDNLDSPEVLMNLGNLQRARGNLESARRYFKQAIVIASRFIAPLVNLADLERRTNNEDLALELLYTALNIESRNPDVNLALGLHAVRSGQRGQALAFFATAANNAGEQPYFSWVYAIALKDSGNTREAILVLQNALEKHPQDNRLRQALASFTR